MESSRLAVRPVESRPLASVPVAQLYAAADGIRKQYDETPSTDLATAYSHLKSEFAARGLFWEPLTKCDDDGDGDDGDGDDDGDDKPSPKRSKKYAKPGANTSEDNMMGKSFVVSTPEAYDYITKAGGAAPHVFVPVRNVCKVCRGPGGDNHPNDHAFAPVRNICKTCGSGAESHVSKYVGGDASYVAAAMIVAKALTEITTSTNDLTPFAKRDYTVEERQDMADKGLALPDGSFPIASEADLHNAVRLVAQAPNPQEAMNFIIERAKTMGMTHALPPAWNVPDEGTTAPAPPAPGAHGMAPDVPKPKKPGAGMGGVASPSGGAGAGAGGGSGGGASLASPASASPTSASPPPPMVKMFTGDLALDASFDQAVIKSAPENRYTLAPVYLPNTYDAHEEWATPEDLQKSMWDYVRKTGGDRTVYLQHSPQPAGEWVELVCWPSEVRTSMTKSIDGVTKAVETVMPAGTAYMGTVWQPWAWDLVKSGRLTGMSMGGMAARVEADI